MSDRDDELLRHIGTLWKTAMVGLDTLREVAVRSTQTGRLRVDIALLQRERAQLLETLGEMIVSMIDDGSFEDVPESVQQTYERIKDVEGRIQSDDAKAHDNAFGASRGYEPEAASDYGDEESGDELAADGADGGDSDDGDDGDSEPAAPAPRTSAAARASKTRSTNGKRGANHR